MRSTAATSSTVSNAGSSSRVGSMPGRLTRPVPRQTGTIDQRPRRPGREDAAREQQGLTPFPGRETYAHPARGARVVGTEIERAKLNRPLIRAVHGSRDTRRARDVRTPNRERRTTTPPKRHAAQVGASLSLVGRCCSSVASPVNRDDPGLGLGAAALRAVQCDANPVRAPLDSRFHRATISDRR